MRTPDEYRALVDDYLDSLTLVPGADESPLGDAMRYALEGGGKRLRPVLCLSAGEAAGAPVGVLVPAAAAVELVHTFGLVHDDLPALDDDDERRGRPSVHVEFGEALGLLAGDALLALGLQLAASYESSEVANELAAAAVLMIQGQALDVSARGSDLETIHALKTASLFSAAVSCALWLAEVPPGEPQAAWRRFGHDYGLLFQVVDDLRDQDGIVDEQGVASSRQLAETIEQRALSHLDELDADTTVLAELVSGLSARAEAR